MDFLIDTLVPILISVLACSGFWTFVQNRNSKKDKKTQMLIGLGHDRIIDLGMKYIERGWVTKDEYENLVDYLYCPYKSLGGNGAAERIVNEVKKLEIRSSK